MRPPAWRQYAARGPRYHLYSNQKKRRHKCGRREDDVLWLKEDRPPGHPGDGRDDLPDETTRPCKCRRREGNALRLTK